MSGHPPGLPGKNRQQKARGRLSLALTLVHNAEDRAREHRLGLDSAERDLIVLREDLRLATEDARKSKAL